MKVAPPLLLAALILAASARAASTNPLLAPLNDAVNALLSTAGVPASATAVVPIVSSGGVHLGYAQVAGPASSVGRVRAVLALRAPRAAGWNITALVPVSTVTGGGTIHRIAGVNVDALINYGG